MKKIIIMFKSFFVIKKQKRVERFDPVILCERLLREGLTEQDLKCLEEHSLYKSLEHQLWDDVDFEKFFDESIVPSSARNFMK